MGGLPGQAGLHGRWLGLVPGNRVLLRGAEHADDGGLLVRRDEGRRHRRGTMPLLRARELAAIIGIGQVSHALCDAELAAELDEARARQRPLAAPCCTSTAARPVRWRRRWRAIRATASTTSTPRPTTPA
jgi:hypothetical protein